MNTQDKQTARGNVAAAHDPEPVKQWQCTVCGSPEVFADAYQHLNNTDDIRLFDSTFCEQCEGDANAELVTITNEGTHK